MNKDKKILYIISTVILAVLFFALFIDVKSTAILAAILLVPLAALTFFLIKKRKSMSVQKREVLLLTSVVAVLYVIARELSGMYFGFHKNPYFVTLQIFFKIFLPIVVIIIATEIIRYVLLSQKNRFATVSAFLSCIIAEVLITSNVVGIENFNQFMDVVGMTLLPAICANVYYNYISKNFGVFPNIAFRIITALYVYFIPRTAAVPNALVACVKVLLPIGMLVFVSALYEKRKKEVKNRKSNKLSAVFAILTVVATVSLAMLISCQFRFGAIVIATESMTGEINKGDVIIYERYDDQLIKEGQVIVFNVGQSKIIHRVIKIEHVGNEVRYYTKGDANNTPDDGYITDKDIVGLTDIKVAYAGYPTLWLRELLDGSK